jgi:hypothetical protein
MLHKSLVLLALGTPVLVLLGASSVHGDVFSYECDSFPTEAGWELMQVLCDPQEWLEDGWLFHHVELCEEWPPPGGQQIGYTRSLADQEGEVQWFVQCRLMTDGPRSEFDGVAPAAFSVWSLGAVRYNFTIADDQAKLNRDNTLPIAYADIEPGVPHTHRLELHGEALYVWYIDGEVVDSGVPEGPYPSFYPGMNFGTSSWEFPNTTQWDYIRYGPIPQPGSGDYDSNGNVDETDLAFFQDCLLGPDANGPGCRWADLNGDRKVNGADIPLFVDALLAPEPPPPPAGQEHASPPRPGVHSINFDPRPGAQPVTFDTPARE